MIYIAARVRRLLTQYLISRHLATVSRSDHTSHSRNQLSHSTNIRQRPRSSFCPHRSIQSPIYQRPSAIRTPDQRIPGYPSDFNITPVFEQCLNVFQIYLSSQQVRSASIIRPDRQHILSRRRWMGSRPGQLRLSSVLNWARPCLPRIV